MTTKHADAAAHPAAQHASRAEPPRAISGRLAPLAKAVAHAAALPIRALATERAPAIEHPELLSPGDPPPTGGRLLLLFDGGCGICLHARDVFAAWDRGGQRLAFDRIARHDSGLLRDIPAEERYSAWHVVYPDGHQVSGAMGVAATVAALPGGELPASIARRKAATAERGYQWFVRNRGWISRGSGLINHPQRDPREQLHDPRHREVVPNPTP